MAEKPVVVLHRVQPKKGHFDAARKIAENWFQFLGQQKGCKSVELICSIEDQICWIEHWSSKASLDEFVQQHMAYSDHVSSMLAHANGMPVRHAYQLLP